MVQSHHFTMTEEVPSHQNQHRQSGSEPHIRQLGSLKATCFDISVTALLQTAVYLELLLKTTVSEMFTSVAMKLPGITLNPKPPRLVKWLSYTAHCRLESCWTKDDIRTLLSLSRSFIELLSHWLDI